MPNRYYSAQPITDSTVTLDGTEAHHLLHVMRAKPGLELILFDGHGGQFDAEVTACNRSTVEVAVGERQPLERELPFAITLAVALPKGDRQRWLVEKCVELGVSQIIPLKTARNTSKGANKIDNKLSRYVIEASKQCGRNRLLEIVESVAWHEYLEQTSADERLLAHPYGKPISELNLQLSTSKPLQITIGPEGGFTDEEVAQAIAAGWQQVGLGERILRIETAVVALVSALTLR